MIKFTQPNENNSLSKFSSVSFTLNGEYLENKIEGYKTIKVSGREVLDELIRTEKVEGRDGEIFINKTKPIRELEITYYMKAKTNEELQIQYRKLADALNSDSPFEIEFDDDKGIFFYGMKTKMGKVSDSFNEIVSTFTLTCFDPYKYSLPIKFSGNPINILLDSTFKTNPDEIKITINSDVSKINIENLETGRRIVLDGSYNVGDVITINWKNRTIRNGNINILNNVDETVSVLKGFTVEDGQRIQITPLSCGLQITIRERWG